MNTENSNTETNKYLFINLVSMLSMSAMQQMGKLVDPAAGKAGINLDAAQATIDMLDMLSAKTQGNLDKDEARLMKDTLSTLKMNFVETKEMQNASAVAQGAMADASRGMKNEKPAQSGGAEAAKPEEQGKAAEPKPEEEPPKFHKSYT